MYEIRKEWTKDFFFYSKLAFFSTYVVYYLTVHLIVADFWNILVRKFKDNYFTISMVLIIIIITHIIITAYYQIYALSNVTVQCLNVYCRANIDIVKSM